MKISSALCRILLLTGLTLALPVYSSAQVTKSDTPPGAITGPIVMPQPFTFEIRDGTIIENGKPAGVATIGNVLDYLKKQGKAFNITMGPGVADLRISDLVLNLPEFNGNAVFEAIAASVKDEVISSIVPRAGIYRLDLAQGPPRQVQVFNLTEYLNPDGKADNKVVQEKLDSLTDIIFKTLKDLDPAFSDAAQPHYQFHKGANLLVVIGTPEALSVANQVVNALQPPEGTSLSNTLKRMAETDPAGAIAWGWGQSQSDSQALKNTIAQWANNNPADAMAWAQSLPNTQVGEARMSAEIQNLLAQLKAEAENKDLSNQQLLDLQNRLSLLNQQIQDMVSQGFKVAPRVAPEKVTSP